MTRTDTRGPGRRAALAGAVLAALAAGLLPPDPARAGETVTLSQAEVETGIRSALSRGQPALARDLAQTLLAHDPDNFTGHAGLAIAALDMGHPRTAAAAARKAQTTARSPVERYESALLRSRALAASDPALGGVAAMFWARRAVELAPGDAYRQVAAGELIRTRAETPLHLQFGLSIAPSGNVNNGSRQSHVELPGFDGLLWQLSPQSRALSGWVAEASLAGRYRLAQGAASATFLRFAAQRREVRLSGASIAAIESWRQDQIAAGQTPPDVPDYDYGMVEIGGQHLWRRGQTQWSLGLSAGHSWFGGADLADSLRLDLGAERGIRPDLALFGSLSAERQWGHAQADADVLALRAGALHRLGSGDRLRLTGTLRDTRSASTAIRNQALGLRLGWEKARPLAGIGIEASVGAETRRYDPSALSPAGRRDLRLDATLSLSFEKLDYMGFMPVVNLNAARVSSNTRLYEGTDAGLTLGFRSRF